ncbi:MAG: hypothetical protein AAB401_06710, partial [Acidobacteriota bacterium]
LRALRHHGTDAPQSLFWRCHDPVASKPQWPKFRLKPVMRLLDLIDYVFRSLLFTQTYGQTDGISVA